jgi:hypothetical protein
MSPREVASDKTWRDPTIIPESKKDGLNSFGCRVVAMDERDEDKTEHCGRFGRLRLSWPTLFVQNRCQFIFLCAKSVSVHFSVSKGFATD